MAKNPASLICMRFVTLVTLVLQTIVQLPMASLNGNDNPQCKAAS